MSTRSFTVTLRDYVDVVELRMRATMLATACGLGRRQQGLVAVAVTEAGVFALQHVGRSAAELRVENDAAASHLMVEVRGAGSVVGLAETRLPTLDEDGGLMLAERAAERFSVSTEPAFGTKVTMGWTLPAVRSVGQDDLFETDDGIGATSSLIDVLQDENREVAVVLEALGETGSAIETNGEMIGRLTGDLETANRELIALQWELDLAREAEACLAAIVHFSDDAMFSMTPALVLTSWNPGAEHLLGHSAEEMIGRPLETLIAEGALGEFGVALERLAAGERVATYDTFRRRKDGSLVEATVTTSAMSDGSGRLIGYSTVLRDLAAGAATGEAVVSALGDEPASPAQVRIAHDLRDLVMERLFACGMSLRNTLMLDPRSDVVSRIESVIDELDANVADLLRARSSNEPVEHRQYARPGP